MSSLEITEASKGKATKEQQAAIKQIETSISAYFTVPIAAGNTVVKGGKPKSPEKDKPIAQDGRISASIIQPPHDGVIDIKTKTEATGSQFFRLSRSTTNISIEFLSQRLAAEVLAIVGPFGWYKWLQDSNSPAATKVNETLQLLQQNPIKNEVGSRVVSRAASPITLKPLDAATAQDAGFEPPIGVKNLFTDSVDLIATDSTLQTMVIQEDRATNTTSQEDLMAIMTDKEKMLLANTCDEVCSFVSLFILIIFILIIL